MYIAYSDMLPLRIFLYGFLAFFIIATGVHVLGTKRAWHRKYLDYRTLAEGLRVQLYWSAAGVGADSRSKYTHDTFLMTPGTLISAGFSNVMRVAGTECDACQLQATRQVSQFVLREMARATKTPVSSATSAARAEERVAALPAHGAHGPDRVLGRHRGRSPCSSWSVRISKTCCAILLLCLMGAMLLFVGVCASPTVTASRMPN